MKKYYLQIEKKPGGIWEASLFSRENNGDDLNKIECIGTLKTDVGMIEAISLASSAGWYDNYLNI